MRALPRSACRYKFAAGLVRQLSVLPAPPSIWASIEEALPLPTTPRVPVTAFSLPRFAFACLLALTVIAAGMYWSLTRSGRSSLGSSAAGSWEVSRLDDATGPMRMAPGEWVRTDASSRARITVGTIGTVDVEPGTHVRLGQMGADQFRIALDRGTISATINAPPRLFIVDTPTSTVVDLGCAYTMHVGADGGVELRVTSGWTSLEWQGMASLIPAGAQARTRPGMGPGTPSFEDASPTLREALVAFDFEAGGSTAVAVVSQRRGYETRSRCGTCCPGSHPRNGCECTTASQP